MSKIIRMYFVGQIPFGRLYEYDGGKVYLKTESLGLPFDSIAEAEAELQRQLQSGPQPLIACAKAKPPYENHGYAVSFSVASILGIVELPSGAPPASQLTQIPA